MLPPGGKYDFHEGQGYGRLVVQTAETLEELARARSGGAGRNLVGGNVLIEVGSVPYDHLYLWY